MNMRHKTAKDENFPVSGFLVRKDLRGAVELYYEFARYADDIADNPQLTPEAKLEKLHELEDIVEGAKYKGKKLLFAKKLGQLFNERGLSLSLALDLLIAFRKDAIGFRYETWGQLVNYCTYSAAPVGRFLLALYNENPASYLPCTSLCAALQIVNHLQDIKYDAMNLNRVYLPEEFLKRYGVDKNALLQDKSSEGLRKVILLVLELVEGQLKEAELLLSIVRSKRLRLEISVIISLTAILIKKIKRGDVLSSRVKLSSFDKIRGLWSGLLRFLRRRQKTLPGGN